MFEQELTPKQRCFDESLAVFKDSLIELAEFYLHHPSLITLKIADELLKRLKHINEMSDQDDLYMKDLIYQLHKIEITQRIKDDELEVELDFEDLFREAVNDGNLAYVEVIFEKDVNHFLYDLDERLCDACENGHAEVVRFLLENGVDVHAGNDYPLRLASCNNHAEVVKILAEWIMKEKGD